MKKIILILLAVSFLFQFCKNEVPQKKDENRKPIYSEEYCYINSIDKKNGRIFASLNFIKYLKKTDIDKSINKTQLLELPNEFCYLDEKKEYESFEFSDNAKIIMQTLSFNSDGNFNFNQTIGANELLKYFSKPESERLKFSPFKVVISNNKIISLEEIYIP
jgi:hypothetical protein